MSVLSQTGRTFFNAATLTSSSYVYVPAGGSGNGWIACEYDDVTIQYAVATLNATSVSVRVEGKFAPLNRAASIHADEVTSAQSIDEIVNIPERFEYVRVGAKIDNTSTPNIFYAGVSFTEYK